MNNNDEQQNYGRKAWTTKAAARLSVCLYNEDTSNKSRPKGQQYLSQ